MDYATNILREHEQNRTDAYRLKDSDPERALKAYRRAVAIETDRAECGFPISPDFHATDPRVRVGTLRERCEAHRAAKAAQR